MTDDPIKHILVELDCLLDTRLATLELLSPVATQELINSGAYWTRESDDFELLTHGAIRTSDFNTAYAQRNKETLKRARPTKAIKLLSSIAKEVELQKIDAPNIESLKIAVNVYPYTLTVDEIRILCTAVMCYGGLETEVTTVNKALKELTPKAIKQQWDGLIIYNFDDWFTHNAELLTTTPIPRHLLFAPALYIKPIERPEDVQITSTTGGVINPFTAVEMAMVAHLCLELLRPEEFSIVRLD
jgi:hypothetical protein